MEKLNQELLKWAEGKYQEQVKFRPDQNIYKATLHHVWMQVINKLKESPTPPEPEGECGMCGSKDIGKYCECRDVIL